MSIAIATSGAKSATTAIGTARAMDWASTQTMKRSHLRCVSYPEGAELELPTLNGGVEVDI
jgi:hypothetical protein